MAGELEGKEGFEKGMGVDVGHLVRIVGTPTQQFTHGI